MHRALLVLGILAIAAATGGAQPSGGIKGRVLAGESGAPIAGATVTLRSVDDTTVVFTTHASPAGVYHFDVPAGRYDLRAADDSRLPSLVRVVVPEASEIEIDVVLSLQSKSAAQAKALPASPFFNLSEPNYFLFGFQDFTGNEPVASGAYANQGKFRVAIRYRILTLSNSGYESGLHLGYRQNSFWNLWEKSAPFFDNNYNPQAFLYLDSRDYSSQGWAPSALLFVDHESNGRDGVESRAWNRYGAGVELGDVRRTAIFGSARIWEAFDIAGENRDIRDFAGRGEVVLSFQPLVGYGVPLGSGGVSARLRVGGRTFVPSSEIDAFLGPPAAQGRGFFGRLSRLNLSLMAQWFHGTSESLLVYREKHSVMRFGVATVR